MNRAKRMYLGKKRQAGARRLGLVPLLALIVSAAPMMLPEDLIRAGNQAVEREDYEAALRLYQQAEERSTDPGLIAFNEATAYYHLRDFRQAETHFRMSLDDAEAPMPRRASAFFNLGDCLVEQAGDKDAPLLREAIHSYENCLDCMPSDELRQDAVHNLELAKLLWNKARARSPETNNPNDDPPDRPPPDQKNNSGEDMGTGVGGDEQRQDVPKAQRQSDGIETGNEAPKKADAAPETQARRVPVPPDTDEVKPSSAADTQAALRFAEDRLKRARERNRADLSIPDQANGKDW